MMRVENETGVRERLQDRGRQIVVLEGAREKEKGASRNESGKGWGIKVQWSCRHAE